MIKLSARYATETKIRLPVHPLDVYKKNRMFIDTVIKRCLLFMFIKHSFIEYGRQQQRTQKLNTVLKYSSKNDNEKLNNAIKAV